MDAQVAPCNGLYNVMYTLPTWQYLDVFPMTNLGLEAGSQGYQYKVQTLDHMGSAIIFIDYKYHYGNEGLLLFVLSRGSSF